MPALPLTAKVSRDREVLSGRGGIRNTARAWRYIECSVATGFPHEQCARPEMSSSACLSCHWHSIGPHLVSDKVEASRQLHITSQQAAPYHQQAGSSTCSQTMEQTAAWCSGCAGINKSRPVRSRELCVVHLRPEDSCSMVGEANACLSTPNHTAVKDCHTAEYRAHATANTMRSQFAVMNSKSYFSQRATRRSQRLWR